MKAAMYYGLGDIRIENMPTPKIGRNEMLVEMKACSICGSDLMGWYLQKRVPLVLGHEPTGVVAETGSEVKNFQAGDRVFVHHHVACLTCHYCLHGDYTMCEQFSQTHIEPGGFAQFFKVPAPNIQIDTLKLPETLSFEEATLIEPIACCIRALKKCGIQQGDTIAIIGAGPSGIIHCILAKHFGATQTIVSDMVDYRLEMARKFGADVTVNPQKENFLEKTKEITENKGADVVIVTAPNPKAYENGIQACRKGGTVCIFAPTPPNTYLNISPHKLFFHEIKITPSYSTSHIETRTALQYLLTKEIDAKKLITHRFPLSRISEAFQTAAEGKNCLKVVVLNE
ncbi:MAG: zinc-dependent dehydrogenase [Candidatus Bathyarchaeia archaeon]